MAAKKKTPAWILELAKGQKHERAKKDWLAAIIKADPSLGLELIATAEDWLANGEIRKMCPTPTRLATLFCAIEGVSASVEAVRHWAARLEQDPERLNGYQ